MQRPSVTDAGAPWAQGGAEEPDYLIEVSEADAGGRIDRVLAQAIPSLSRSRLQVWIGDGLVSIEERPIRSASHRVQAGDQIAVFAAEAPEAMAFAPEALPLNVVHEDADVFVIDKPAGLVVHPAAGNWSGTLLNGLLHLAPELARVPRAGIVHRLDKDTSGLMVVARSLEAQVHLAEQIRQREVSRRYIAFTHRSPSPGVGTIDQPIGRDPRNRLRMAVVAGGKPSVTHYRMVARDAEGGAARIHCSLDTGRTHQIRVHLAHIACPLVGDVLYGGRPLTVAGVRIERQALHAARLAFASPGTGERLRFAAALPEDLAHLASSLRLDRDLRTQGEFGDDSWPT
ncbi:MAG TPA: RluA family pseudouridine synthase [Burkholderiaceae bacterium]|nr:RluA family pseudouridine synthase [Burkholderiaceae bacterium]